MKEGLFLSAALLVFNFSFSQTKVGLKGGVNYSMLEMRDQTLWRAGYNVGGLVRHSLSKKFSIQSELLYSAKGYKTHPIQGFDQANVSLKYINIPVLLVLHSTEKFSFLVGPEFDYLAGATSRLEGKKHNVIEVFNRSDFGVDAAISYKVFNKSGFELRYSHGFKTIMKQYHFIGDAVEKTSVGRNRSVQLNFYHVLGK